MKIVCVEAVSLFDGRSEGLLGDASLVIGGGLISGVHSGLDETGEPVTDRIIDGRGLTAIPGLINLHVHLCLDIDRVGDRTDPSSPLLPGSDEDVVLRMLGNARETLEAGITTVRDLGAPGDTIFLVRRLIEEGLAFGPRIIASGPVITRTGGHGWFIGEEADGASEVRKAVRSRVKSGADVIKLMVTGGYLTRGTSPFRLEYSVEEIQVAVEEAHRSNVPVAVHAAGREGIEAALDACVDTIEHGAFMTEELVTQMIDQEATWVPTMGVALDAQRPENQEIIRLRAKRMSSGVRSSWRRVEEMTDQDRLREGRKAFRGSCHAEGLRLGIGNDAGTLFARHEDLLSELHAFTECGFSNADVLRMATRGNAEILRLEDRMGTIEAGKLADIVLVDSNPLEDLEALRHVVVVIKEGRIAFVRSGEEHRVRDAKETKKSDDSSP